MGIKMLGGASAIAATTLSGPAFSNSVVLRIAQFRLCGASAEVSSMISYVTEVPRAAVGRCSSGKQFCAKAFFGS